MCIRDSPRVEACKGNEAARQSGHEVVQLLQVDGKDYLFYKSVPLDICFIRGTYADETGNVSMVKEGLRGDQLEMAMATRNSGGIVVVQVEKMVQKGSLPVKDIKKPRVGIVGEILVKFSPTANNNLVELLESEGAEAVMPDLVDFFLYGFRNATFKVEKLGFDKSIIRMNNLGIKAIEWMRGSAKKALIESKHFTPTADIDVYKRQDCYALRAFAIHPDYSHIVKLTLHFYAHIRACPKVVFPPLCKHRWDKTF